MAGKGGARPGAGRKKGIPNKSTAEVRDLAQQYGPAALKELARMGGLLPRRAGAAKSEQARVTAVNSVLDRAYGKATQPMEHSVDEGLEAILDRLGRIS